MFLKEAYWKYYDSQFQLLATEHYDTGCRHEHQQKAILTRNEITPPLASNGTNSLVQDVTLISIQTNFNNHQLPSPTPHSSKAVGLGTNFEEQNNKPNSRHIFVCWMNLYTNNQQLKMNEANRCVVFRRSSSCCWPNLWAQKERRWKFQCPYQAPQRIPNIEYVNAWDTLSSCVGVLRFDRGQFSSRCHTWAHLPHKKFRRGCWWQHMYPI